MGIAMARVAQGSALAVWEKDSKFDWNAVEPLIKSSFQGDVSDFVLDFALGELKERFSSFNATNGAEWCIANTVEGAKVTSSHKLPMFFIFFLLKIPVVRFQDLRFLFHSLGILFFFLHWLCYHCVIC